LQTVESVVGRPRLDAFLRGYFDHFQFQPMTSERALDYMRSKLLTEAEAAKIDVRAWIYDQPLPCAGAREALRMRDRQSPLRMACRRRSPPGWSSHEWLHFLRGLPETLETQVGRARRTRLRERQQRDPSVA
jgi:hypothetical protein